MAGGNCYKKLDNCNLHSYTASGVGAVYCLTCNTGFYKNKSSNATECLEGSTANCVDFASSSNTCIACKNGFFFFFSNVCF